MTQPPPPEGPQDPQGGWPQPQQPYWQPTPSAWPPAPAPPPPPSHWQPPQSPMQPGAYNPAAPYPGGEWEHLGGPVPTREHKPHGRGRLIAAAVAVVALAGGGVATYVAVSDSNSHHGAATPKEAVQGIVEDINNSDLVGFLDDLAPGERRALMPFLDDIKELKRNHVLQDSADPHNVAAVKTSIKGLKFAGDATINDHVQVVQLTGGIVDFSADFSKIPFTDEFAKAVFPHGVPSGNNQALVDIADVVRDDGKPVRIATQKVDGRWYPSLFYTMADSGARDSGQGVPTAVDYVAPKGASSAEGAVKTLVTSLLEGDVTGAIEVLSPDELAVLHDYAGVIMKSTGRSYPVAPVSLDELKLDASAGPDGTQRVTLASIALTAKNGDRYKFTVDGTCYEATLPGEPVKRMCVQDVIKQINDALTDSGVKPLTSAQSTALTHLFSGGVVGGIITSQSGGKWYVNPVQTEFDSIDVLLQRLQGNDLLELVGLIEQLFD
jgi:hypothetical protein